MNSIVRAIFLLSIIFLILSSCKKKTLFEKISSDKTNIHFNNMIQESDSLNPLDTENMYNGGGVGIADFNDDGLQDVFFSGNMVDNKLYLNKGDFEFQEVTKDAGVNGAGRWSRGVSVVDINNDGLMDMYISASLLKDSKKRQNLLYVNQGNEKGVPQFKDEAAEYGLADTVHSTMAAFFDYDNDGDLDMYLVVNEIIQNQYPNTFHPLLKNSEHPNTDKLFRNDWNRRLNHPVFTDVSKISGITLEGYGHAVCITDINKDGWKDIYVTNDFLSPNNLFINQHDGTFLDQAASYFKHTSENSMGADVIDVNNDGLDDVIEVDMNPEDNYRKKMMLNPLSYQRYQSNEFYKYPYQYVRNVLQINQGPRVEQQDSVGAPIFSDLSFYAGIAATDWSWTPLVNDFDNDGYRDLIVTNGFPKDVTDHDFIAYRNKANMLATKKELITQIPQIKISNYSFKNNGNLTFTNTSADWGLTDPSFANGAAYADLDNDGDMDFVVNNINDEASIYQNNSNKLNDKAHYLQIEFIGDSLNKNGIGARAELHYKGNQQVYENTPYRGYLSSVSGIAHFGLGNFESVDSLIISWPNGKKQLLRNVKVDQILKVNVLNANKDFSDSSPKVASSALFRNITDSLNLKFVHRDSDFVDFNIQKLLPHKFSEYGPALAVGDIDGNGFDDLICGGSFFHHTQVFLQQSNGKFLQRNLLKDTSKSLKMSEDMGALLFDADGDKDLDLYIASGGYEGEPNSSSYQDRFYVNDGKGNYTLNSSALPKNFTSKSCVRAADFDRDGDLDLFVAGRVDPWNYPKPVSSFIYRNESKPGQIKFVDVTLSLAPKLNNIGLVCDAVFSDVDNDGWQDLVLAGEWMPLTIMKNNRGKFAPQSLTETNDDETGWWNSLAPGDFDNDGDTDYIAGNLGTNSFYKASKEFPIGIIAKDFDSNGSYDAVPSIYLPESSENPVKKEVPAQLRDDMIKQMIGFRAKYTNYRSYALSGMNSLFTAEQLSGSLHYKAQHLESSYLRNDGNGKFTVINLPQQAQVSILNGMVVEDFDGDGNLDIIMNGNDFGTDVSVGRYDALNGLMLKGKGDGTFSVLSIMQSGIYIPGNGKALVKLRGTSGKCLVAASQNKGSLKIFELKKDLRSLSINSSDVSIMIKYKSGKVQKREINNGYSFLSQSDRSILVNEKMISCEITDSKGNKRNLDLKAVKN